MDEKTELDKSLSKPKKISESSLNFLRALQDWRRAVQPVIEDFGIDPIPHNLFRLTEKVSLFCDKNGIDPTPFWDICRVLLASEQPDPEAWVGPRPTKKTVLCAFQKAFTLYIRLDTLIMSEAEQPAQAEQPGKDGEAENNKKKRKSKFVKKALILSYIKENPGHHFKTEIGRATEIDRTEVGRILKDLDLSIKEVKRDRKHGYTKYDIKDESASCKYCRGVLSNSFECKVCNDTIKGECKTCHWTNIHPDDAIP